MDELTAPVEREPPADLLATWFRRLAPDLPDPSGEDVSSQETSSSERCTPERSAPSVARLSEAESLPSNESGTPERPALRRAAHESARETLLLSIARSAMACEFEVLLNQHQYPQAADRAVEALDLVQQLENQLSVYQPRSELSTLNQFGATRPIPLSHDTLQLLELGKALFQLTAGAFDMTAGSLSEAWGFSRRQGRVPSSEEIEESLATVGDQHVLIDRQGHQARLALNGVKVNPGGIGKGYALDRAVARLRQAGVNDFMMHGGLSSVVARGNRQHPETGGGWLVSLRHPWNHEQTLGSIRLQDQALATSGSGKQFFHFGGKRYSHIIDPRSGWPATGMMSVTVICPSGAVADALATAMFVMGPDQSRRFCQTHREIAAILIFSDPDNGRTRLEILNATDDAMWQPQTLGQAFG